MGQADGEPAQGEEQPLGVAGEGVGAAHVAVHRVHGPPGEDLEHRGVGDVAGVDDHLAVAKTPLHLLTKAVVGADEMGIGENAGADRHGNLAAVGVRGLDRTV